MLVMRPLTLLMLPLLALATSAQAEVVRKTVEYKLPTGQTAKGVAVYDDAKTGKRPGVLVIPEFWGLTDYPQMRAEQLAEEGYVAFVADMYGDGKTTADAKEAGRLSGEAKKTGLAKLAKPALDELKKMEQVDAENVAAIGFCFGGSTVVAMAGSDYGSQLKGVVSFHGGLGGDAAPAGSTYNGPPMLILHGGADPLVKPADFAAFVQKSIEAGVPITVSSFPGALHAYTNPEADEKARTADMQGKIAYDEAATKISLEIMEEFLESTVGEPNGDDEDD